MKQLEQEGVEVSIARHETAGKAVRAAVKAMGLHYICRSDDYADNAVTAVLLPKSIEDYGIRKHVVEQYVVIFGDAKITSWELCRPIFLDNSILFCYSGCYKRDKELRF